MLMLGNTLIMKKILYVDMDGVVAGFDHIIKQYNPSIDTMDGSRAEEVDRIMLANRRLFLDLPLMEGAEEALELLKPHFEIYFLSTPVWDIHESWGDKKLWLEKHFGEFATKRLILTHRKDLARGHYLVDDRHASNGTDNFKGVFIHFGSPAFPDWRTVTTYLLNNK